MAEEDGTKGGNDGDEVRWVKGDVVREVDGDEVRDDVRF